MRLLLANPNTTVAVTERMAGVARAIASPGTEIAIATAAFGAEVIATRTEMAIAEHACISLLAAQDDQDGHNGYDGVIIGASLDSGLRAAREMLGLPVLGITQAALHAACLLGGRFGVITTSAGAAAITREMIEGYGLTTRLAGMRWLATDARNVLEDPDSFVSELSDAALSLIRQDQADTVVLIGAVMAGMPARVQSGISVPVLEGVSCAIPMVEGLVRLALPRGPALPARRLVGVDEPLRLRFGRSVRL